MPAEPRISIVTPSFNHGCFVLQTIRSILEQPYGNLDYLVIDDGSTDNSAKLLAGVSDPRLRVAVQENQGLPHVLDRGFRETEGEIMGWVNSDDMLLPGALSKVAARFAANPVCDFLYGDGVIVDQNNKLVRVRREIAFNRNILLWDFCYVLQPGAFWRRSLYNRVGGINVAFRHCMDMDLWLRFSQQTRPVHLPEFLCIVRDHPETQSRKQPQTRAREDALVREAILGRPATRWEEKSRKILFKFLRVAKKAVRRYYWAKPPSLWSWMDAV